MISFLRFASRLSSNYTFVNRIVLNRIVLLGFLLGWSQWSLPAGSQVNSETAITEITQLNSWLDMFRSPPRTGRPVNTANGSSRDALRCKEEEPLIRPLLPEDGYGLTLSAHPEIFVDVSETSAQQVLLVFRNEARTDFQEVILPIQSTNRIKGFQLPAETHGLSTGETYQWSLSFICGDYFTLNDPSITGWVRRTEITPEIQQILAEPSRQRQAEWLGNNGYWYDLVSQLINSID